MPATPTAPPARLEVESTRKPLKGRRLREKHKGGSSEDDLARLAAIVNSSSDGIIAKTLLGKVSSWNRAAERMFGYTAQEMAGQSISRLIPEDRSGELQLILDKAVRKEAMESFETVRLHKDGREIPVSITSSPIENARGEVMGVSSIVRDMTGRKALEKQLRLSQRLETLGLLAGGVAHDFNNLVAVIRGNADLLRLGGEGFGAEARECIEEISSATERASNLIRQLLTFSHDHDIETQRLDLNQVIRDLAKLLRRVLREDIGLDCRLAAEPLYAEADQGLLEQVIMNLAINARDAINNGGQLSISTELVTLKEKEAESIGERRAGDFVLLKVEDTGEGIAPENLPHVFEPFFTTKARGEGTGLGLATVRNIVRKHQGWIEVTSQPKVGTRFRVFLPAARGGGSSETPSWRDEGKIVCEGTETLMLVEDDRAVRKTTQRLLRTYGYRVLEASSGGEAWELWQQSKKKPDLIVTDSVLPGKTSGRELITRLRRIDPKLKAICMTGYGQEPGPKGARAKAEDWSYVLQKPVSSSKLLETIRRCLDRG